MAIIFALFFPPIAPLIAMFMLGNLLREVEATGRLANAAAKGITNAIVFVLAVAIGSTMAADKFLTVQTGQIVMLGMLAFAFGVASSLALAKLMNLSFETPGDPLTPIAGAYKGARDQAMGAASASMFGAAILGGIMLLALGGK